MPGTSDDQTGATIREAAAPAPRLLDGKYELLRLLGEGGMGKVYEARHRVLQRRCAVKFLRPELAHDAEAVKRFVREARAASAIGHRGIIDIHDVGSSPEDGPYLVMELLQGRSLASELAGGRKLPADRAVEIAVQTLRALGAAHAEGIIHRDLKPENLFLADERDAPPTVKILDFGISRVARGEGADERMTATGTVLGTPAYMAPEQAAGESDIDGRLDLYAVGVILFQCLTGRLPFEGSNYNQVIVKIATQDFPRPTAIETSVPPALEAVVLKAAARGRAARYATAGEMVRALTPFLPAGASARLGLDAPASSAGEPLTAPPPDGSVATTRLAAAAARTVAARPTSPRVLAAGALVAILLAVALVVWRPWTDSKPSDAPPAAGRPPAETPAADAAGAPDAPPPPPATAAARPAEVVSISFRNLPPEAVVTYDGAYVAGSSLPVRRSEAAAIVEIEVPGRPPFRQWVVPENDVVISLPPPGATPATTPDVPPPAPRGALETDLFRERMRALRAPLQACYFQALERSPGLEGDVALAIRVDAAGKATAALDLITPALDAAGVGPCLVATLAALDFADRPPTGGEFRVRYPLSFRLEQPAPGADGATPGQP